MRPPQGTASEDEGGNDKFSLPTLGRLQGDADEGVGGRGGHPPQISALITA